MKYPDLSIGLHLALKDLNNVDSELRRQIDRFIEIVGRMPDHIDTHKRHTTDTGIKEILTAYADAHLIPVRNFHAKHIDSFGINTNDASVNQLKKSIDEANDECNELMTHCGYSDEYLRAHSSYNDPREQELGSICNLTIKDYISLKGLKLINWRDVHTKRHKT